MVVTVVFCVVVVILKTGVAGGHPVIHPIIHPASVLGTANKECGRAKVPVWKYQETLNLIDWLIIDYIFHSLSSSAFHLPGLLVMLVAMAKSVVLSLSLYSFSRRSDNSGLFRQLRIVDVFSDKAGQPVTSQGRNVRHNLMTRKRLMSCSCCTSVYVQWRPRKKKK